ncbi:MAG: hypothetical protein ACREP0_07505 [Rhodanobacteraceae bacterium]
MNIAGDPRDTEQHLDALIHLLGRERELLAEGTIDGEALAQVAADKQQMLAALAEFEQRERGPHGGTTPGGLRARAREAARLNRFNGQLIAARRTANRRLLNDLGNLAGNLYGPDGEASNQHSRIASQA